MRVAEGYSTALQWMGELFSEASEDTSLLFDEDWRERMVLALALLRASGQALRELTPPAAFAPAHGHLLVAADHYDAAVDLTVDGIDELDADKLTAAQAEMLLGTEAVQRATEALNAVGEENALPAATNTLPPPTNTLPPPTSAPATATSAPPTEPPPLATIPLPTNTSPPAAAVCDCSGDTLNCGNFNTHNEAQACYNYCWDQTGRDVHQLDGNDNDGLACESLP